MASIINGLFAGRSGVASHGAALAAIGDNISNSSTIGYKRIRAEFDDLVAGGQTSGKIVGSGSGLAQVTTVYEQGTLEFTGRALDLAIDGNGFFVIADGTERYYSRAGNFQVDPAGFLVNASGKSVLGFPEGGSGTLEPININTISQTTVGTTEVTMAGNVDARESVFGGVIPAAPATDAVGTTVTYADLNAVAAFTQFVDIYDSQGGQHTITFFFFKTAQNEFTVRGYINSDEVDPGASPSDGYPRLVTSDGTTSGTDEFVMTFGSDGTRSNAPAVGSSDIQITLPWNNGSGNSVIDVSFDPFTQYATNSNILAITQDGKGVGNITSVSIEKNGEIFANLDNGQTSIIGVVGLVNFASPEGLTRIGGQLLQQSPSSGEPLPGEPSSGTFGEIQSGAVELSTVDIANEFVSLITTQRGFQASARIITTLNQLLNEIIQLA